MQLFDFSGFDIGKLFDFSTYGAAHASIKLIINIILVGGFALSYLMYKKYKKAKDEDPEFEERQEESLREKRRQEQDNKSLDGYLHESDSEYRDE